MQKQICDDLEDANKIGDIRKLFQMAKKLTTGFRPCLHCIKSATGENITETTKIAERWREYCEELYCEELYNKNEEDEMQWDYELEPPPL